MNEKLKKETIPVIWNLCNLWTWSEMYFKESPYHKKNFYYFSVIILLIGSNTGIDTLRLLGGYCGIILMTNYMVLHHFQQWKLVFLARELKDRSKRLRANSGPEFKWDIKYWHKLMMYFILKQQNILLILVYKKRPSNPASRRIFNALISFSKYRSPLKRNRPPWRKHCLPVRQEMWGDTKTSYPLARMPPMKTRVMSNSPRSQLKKASH